MGRLIDISMVEFYYEIRGVLDSMPNFAAPIAPRRDLKNYWWVNGRTNLACDSGWPCIFKDRPPCVWI